MSAPYTDPTTGEYVGEHETRAPDGEISRRTEWFPTLEQARAFSRTGGSCAGGGRVVGKLEQRRAIFHGGAWRTRCPKCERVVTFALAEVRADGMGYVSRVAAHDVAV